MVDNCLFCRIVKGEIPAAKIYEDDEILAFRDIAPQAPVHFLVIPKRHIAGAAAATAQDEALLGRMLRVGSELAQKEGADQFRLVSNNGALAGQSVFHLHVHFLGGRAMGWPPG
ncbi:MAG: histidine triad nucleotide-binding protein [Desulfobulbaceae bacterium A2]|nr:MAG: histidine triad nucleotide-binding protein [Desulfobulbaceae bacterium A2]